MSDDLRQLDHDELELNRFWNELVRPSGSEEPEPAKPASELAETVRHLRALSKAPPPPPAQERLRRGLIDISQAFETNPLAPLDTVPPPRPNGLNGRMPSSLRRQDNSFESAARRRLRWGRWGLAQLSAAALLLITLGIGYIAFDPFGSGDDRPSSIPAAVPTAPTPTPAPVTEETLFEFTVPVEALPKGDGGTGGFTHFTIPPGVRSAWEPYCCKGLIFEYIISGSFTILAEEPIHIMRREGAVEEIPAGVEATLGPGDTLMTGNEVAFEAANIGAIPVELLNWALLEPGDFGGRALPGWINRSADVQGDFHEYAGPVTYQLRQFTLVPDATMLLPEADLRFVSVARLNVQGTPAVGYMAQADDGSIQNTGAVSQAVYVLTLNEVNTPATPSSPESPTP
jgi:hypothetical protein